MRYLIFDASNILYKTFYANNTEDDTTIAGLASHSAFVTINKYVNKFKPDKIIMAFDRPSWRLDYTLSDKCISGKKYKGGRRKNQTKKQEQKYKLFKQHIKDFEYLVRHHTSIITMAEEKLEADDLIAGCAQLFSIDGHESIIISADKDFMQLLKFDNVHLVDPATGDERTLQEYDNDSGLFMFFKCIRGESETGDNVQSAYPRCQKKKMLEAYKNQDGMDYINMMNHEWTHPVSNKKFVVKKLMKENSLLMDLEKQPEDIQELIFEVIEQELASPGKFDYLQFLNYCARFKLKKLADSVDYYMKMLTL